VSVAVNFELATVAVNFFFAFLVRGREVVVGGMRSSLLATLN
jgi:hypothetical protein